MDTKNIIEEFLTTIEKNDGWHPHDSYIVVQLPQSSKVLIERTSGGRGGGECYHTELRNLIPALEKELNTTPKSNQQRQLLHNTGQQRCILQKQIQQQEMQQQLLHWQEILTQQIMEHPALQQWMPQQPALQQSLALQQLAAQQNDLKQRLALQSQELQQLAVQQQELHQQSLPQLLERTLQIDSIENTQTANYMDNLRQQLDSCTFKIYLSAYTMCASCVQSLADFVQSIKDRGCHIKINLCVINVIGKLHQRQLQEAANSLAQLEKQGHLTLRAFGREDLNEVMRLIKRYGEIDPETQRQVERAGRRIEELNTLINWKVKMLRDGRILPPSPALQRAEVFKAFYTSYLHSEPEHQDHKVFCVVKLSQDDVARVYRNTHDPTMHAEAYMVKDLKQVLLSMRSHSGKTHRFTVYQNFSPCKACPGEQLIPFVEEMTESRIVVTVTIKAVGPYKIPRAHCINEINRLKKEGISGPCERKSCIGTIPNYCLASYEETMTALRELSKHPHIIFQSFRSYSDWEKLVELINESPDLVGSEVTFTEDDYKIKYTKSREEEDAGAMEDFQAVLRPC